MAKSNPYSNLVSRLGELSPKDAGLSRQVNELISINELLTTLNSAKTLEESLDILLLTAMGEFPCRRGAVLIKSSSGWRCGAGKGVKSDAIQAALPADDLEWRETKPLVSASSLQDPLLADFCAQHGFEYLVATFNDSKWVGLIALGKGLLGDLDFAKAAHLALIADFGGVVIGSSLYRVDLEEANRQLQRRIFQLNTLYELTGAFARCYENEAVFEVLAKNLMGQFFISRCVVLQVGDPFKIAFCTGVKPTSLTVVGESAAAPTEDWCLEVVDLDKVACPVIKTFMESHKLRYAMAIKGEQSWHAVLLLGPRLNRTDLNQADRDFMCSLAEQAAVALENVALQKEILEKKRLEKELELAREIQQRLLPTEVPAVSGYEISVEMRPYFMVGGDFYDFSLNSRGQMTFCLADVSGKSLPASMIMSTAQAALRALHSFEDLPPDEVVKRLNRTLCSSTQTNKFLTLVYGCLDPSTNELTYINAGHNHPILLKADGEAENLGTGGMVVGLFPNAPYKIGKVPFEPGSSLLIYTDGLSEVIDNQEEEYGEDRLLESFKKAASLESVAEARMQIVADAMTFSNHKMVDDMTLLLIRRR